jgi:hypothetical protein
MEAQPVITIADLRAYPHLKLLVERHLDARGRPKTFHDHMELWRSAGITFPDWLAPFHEQRPTVCTRWNHT